MCTNPNCPHDMLGACPVEMARAIRAKRLDLDWLEANETKRCRTCAEDLPLAEFGVDRSTADGLNRYCKLCIRVKVETCRQGIREMQAARKRHLEVSH